MRSSPNLPWTFNQSFDFVDANGKGYCQPDVILELPERVVVIEVKLSQTWYGDEQIRQLYLPVVEHFYKKPVVPVQMFRNIRKRSEWGIFNVGELLTATEGRAWQWHWYG